MMAIIPARAYLPTSEELRQQEERNFNASFYKIFADGHDLSHAIVNYMICLAKDICPNPAPRSTNSSALVGLLRQKMVVFFPTDKSPANLKEMFASLTVGGHAWRNRFADLFFCSHSYDLQLHIGQLLKDNHRLGQLSIQQDRHYFAEIEYFIQHARYAWHDASLDTLYTIRLLLIEANSRINAAAQNGDVSSLQKLVTTSLNNFQPFFDRLLFALPGVSHTITEVRSHYSRGKILDAVGAIDDYLTAATPGISISASAPESKRSAPSPIPSIIDGENPGAGVNDKPVEDASSRLVQGTVMIELEGCIADIHPSGYLDPSIPSTESLSEKSSPKKPTGFYDAINESVNMIMKHAQHEAEKKIIEETRTAIDRLNKQGDGQPNRTDDGLLASKNARVEENPPRDKTNTPVSDETMPPSRIAKGRSKSRKGRPATYTKAEKTEILASYKLHISEGKKREAFFHNYNNDIPPEEVRQRLEAAEKSERREKTYRTKS